MNSRSFIIHCGDLARYDELGDPCYSFSYWEVKKRTQRFFNENSLLVYNMYIEVRTGEAD